MNHLYLRLDWADIQGEGEDIYDFSPIDEIMEKWAPLGYKFALRFCCYEPWLEYSTPKWVFDLGIAHTKNEFKREDGSVRYAYEPDYNDPVFLEKLEKFLKEAGRRYDGDGRIESLDIGTFGTYGEGHTSSGSNKVYPASVLKKHVNLHLKYFKNTHIIVNDDFFFEAWGASPEDASEIYDYCLGKGLGLRDDSVCVDSYVKKFGFNTLRHPTFFRSFAENAPVDIEFCHIYHNIPERFKEGLPIIEALKTAHATYAGFHGYEEDWYEKTEYLTDYLTNRLGYWLFIDGVDPHTPTEGSFEMIKLVIAGNIIDYGADKDFTIEKARNYVAAALEKEIDIIKAEKLKSLMDQAKTIFYVADNCGEIVFDRFLLNEYREKITLGIRGKAILNDVTWKEIEMSQLGDLPIVTTEDNAPGVSLKKCGKEFLDCLYNSDLIIAKGQGNYESLHEIDRPICHLLCIKCDIMSQLVNIPKFNTYIEIRNA
jgi:hypothetical protein